MAPPALAPHSVAAALATPRADEIAACRGILSREGLLGENVHVSYFGLLEQDKRELLAGTVAARRFRAMLVDMASGASHDVVIVPDEDRIESARELDPAVDGQVPVVLLEFPLVEEIVHKDERWLAAMAKRGLTDLSTLRVNPLSAGVLSESETGRRIQRCFTFVQRTPNDLGWAHPVDGVTVMVDVVTREVLDVIDYVDLPVPQEDGNFHDPAWVGQPDRAGIKPIEITQPEGPSFSIDENGVLSWLGWQLQVGFDQREGLVFHNVSINDGGEQRPVIYRASIAEMMVPYGDPSPQRWFQNFFDCGEYLLGGFANSLALGCDCVGDITYLDAVMADAAGNARTVPQAICIHEEDTGILWKHTDNWNGSSDSRRNRRLVVSFFVTVGNYDYGFYWYFSLDGSIELEVKADRRRVHLCLSGKELRVRLGARPRPRRSLPPAHVQRAPRHDGRRHGQRGGRARGAAGSARRPQPHRHRVHPGRHAPHDREAGPATGRQRARAGVAGVEPRHPEPARQRHRLRAVP